MTDLQRGDSIVCLRAPEVVPVVMISATERGHVIMQAAAEVDGRSRRRVLVDGTNVRELDVLFVHAMTTFR